MVILESLVEGKNAADLCGGTIFILYIGQISAKRIQF